MKKVVNNWQNKSGGVSNDDSNMQKKTRLLLYLTQSCNKMVFNWTNHNTRTGIWEPIEHKHKKRIVSIIKSYIFGCNWMTNRLVEVLFSWYKNNQIVGNNKKKLIDKKKTKKKKTKK